MSDNSPNGSDGGSASRLPKDLLDILVCPVDKSKVVPQGDALVCTQCHRAYPVRDGIPIMLEDEAEILHK
jgi:uncharacterized protein YbaR (Trm112 family)